MATLAKLGKDEQASVSTTIKGKVAETKFWVRKDEETNDRFAIVAALDFSKCSPEEIIALAVKTVNIDLQRRFREMVKSTDAAKKKAAMEGTTWAKIDVKASIIDAARGKSDPLARARNALAKLTDAQRKALGIK